MFELFALAIYSVQWLGVVLGVGGEVVLLVAHLIALHDRKPNWLDSVPAVRTSQFVGLVLIVFSGAAAVAFHIALGQQQLILLPIFGFKWALIIALAVAYGLEQRISKGRVVLEGFAGATWLALFLVHSLAPQTDWTTLLAFYGLWMAFFAVAWTASVFSLKRAAPTAAAAPAFKSQAAAAPAPIALKPIAPPPAIVSHKEVPITPPPKAPPLRVEPAPVVIQKAPAPKAPLPVAAPIPAVPKVAPVLSKPEPIVAQAPQPAPLRVEKSKTEAPVTITESRPSLWRQFLALFARKPKTQPAAPAPKMLVSETARAEKPKERAKIQTPVAAPLPDPKPSMAAVSAPLPKIAASVAAQPAQKPMPQKTAPAAAKHDPSHLPVVEHLELPAPHEAPVPVKAPEAAYVPDWAHLPGLRIMPQKPEDVHLQNRAPLIQA